MAKRKTIPAETKLRLFAAASGHCQKPDCLVELFPIELGGDAHIAEMAHIIPHGETGPRHNERSGSDVEVDGFENLILLCPSCHTKIDKDAASFPRGTLIEWKQGHLGALASHRGIVTYATREEVAAVVSAHMYENKAIWTKFAPVDGSAFEFDPEAESAITWMQRMRSVILPNHYLTQMILDQNVCHATREELSIISEYKEHVRGLTERHISGVAGRAIRFPRAMERIFS